jgi:AraC-like DNA-binding protein
MDTAGFEIVEVPESARPFVRRCMYANRALHEPLVVQPKPTGYAYFSNYFGRSASDYSSVIDGEIFPRRSRFNLAGQIVDQVITVTVEQDLRVVMCELAATACHRVFGVPGSVLVGSARPLADFDTSLADLAAACFVAGPQASRSRHVEEVADFFDRLSVRARPPDDGVEQAVALFEAANGAMSVADICRQLGMGQRQLNRRFAHVVGVPPKFFGQILQINWVVGQLYVNDTSTLTAIAHEAGFYDQAHFNRSMRRFFSESPTAFLKSDHVAFETFLGQSRRYGPSSDPRED